MDYSYPAVFYKEGHKTAVIFPDLENLAACGDNMEDALHMARDACRMYLFISLKDREQLPYPTAASEINVSDVLKDFCKTPAIHDARVQIITVNLTESEKRLGRKMVQKTCSIPMWLNTLCMERDLDFSEILQNALLAKIYD